MSNTATANKNVVVPVVLSKKDRAKIAAEAVRERQGTGMKLNVARGIGFGRKLNEFEVPPQLEQTISTKIEFMDDIFGGEGITPSMSVVVTGGPGAGKTTLCMQLADNLCEAGNIVNYNGLEEAVVQMRKASKRLHLKANFNVSDERLVPKVLDHLRSQQRKNPGKQVIAFFDSLQAHDDGYYANGGTNSMTAVRALEMITDWCKEENGGTYGIAVTIGMVNKDGDAAGKQQLFHTLDAHVHMYIERAKKSEYFGERFVTMRKNRFGCSDRTTIFGIDKERGLYEKVRLDNGIPVGSSEEG